MVETDNEIYFYGLNDQFAYLSNLCKSNFTDKDGKIYCCSEQFLIYQKCIMFDGNNVDLINKILTETNTSKIIEYGRSIKNFDKEIWRSVRYDIMIDGLWFKFKQNNDMKNKLLSTGNKKLYNASKYDNVWGIGYYANNAINMEKKEFGKNLLGQCLMQIRDHFKES